MATASTIIAAALRKLVVVDPGETISAAKMNVGLESLNDMLAQWSSEEMMIYALTQESFTLTSAQSYTIGTGGTFNTVAPVEIVSAFTRVSGTDYPCEIITVEEYNDISNKGNSGSYPNSIAYRNAKPLGRIYTYPVSTGTLFLEIQKLLQNFATSSTVYTLPGEAMLAVKTNLAVILATEFGKTVDPDLKELASSTKASLKAMYVQTPLAQFEFPATSGRRNFLAG